MSDIATIPDAIETAIVPANTRPYITTIGRALVPACFDTKLSAIEATIFQTYNSTARHAILSIEFGAEQTANLPACKRSVETAVRPAADATNGTTDGSSVLSTHGAAIFATNFSAIYPAVFSPVPPAEFAPIDATLASAV